MISILEDISLGAGRLIGARSNPDLQEPGQLEAGLPCAAGAVQKELSSRTVDSPLDGCSVSAGDRGCWRKTVDQSSSSLEKVGRISPADLLAEIPGKKAFSNMTSWLNST